MKGWTHAPPQWAFQAPALWSRIISPYSICIVVCTKPIIHWKPFDVPFMHFQNIYFVRPPLCIVTYMFSVVYIHYQLFIMSFLSVVAENICWQISVDMQLWVYSFYCRICALYLLRNFTKIYKKFFFIFQKWSFVCVCVFLAVGVFTFFLYASGYSFSLLIIFKKINYFLNFPFAPFEREDRWA